MANTQKTKRAVKRTKKVTRTVRGPKCKLCDKEKAVYYDSTNDDKELLIGENCVKEMRRLHVLEPLFQTEQVTIALNRLVKD